MYEGKKRPTLSDMGLQSDPGEVTVVERTFELSDRSRRPGRQEIAIAGRMPSSKGESLEVPIETIFRR